VNVDQDLDDIVDSIDLSKLIPKEEIKEEIKEKEKEESSKRVLSAVKDYNPVERDKSIAKRKALEQEIVRQTEEFDRLAEITRKKKEKETGMTQSSEDATKTATTCVSTHSHSSETTITSRKSKLSKSDWLRIIRCILLTSLGVCVGKLGFVV
jgi:hypothetical protein